MVKRLLNKLLFPWRYGREVKRANKEAAKSGKRQIVLMVAGRPMATNRQRFRRLIKRGLFQPGFTYAKALELAVYKTAIKQEQQQACLNAAERSSFNEVKTDDNVPDGRRL